MSSTRSLHALATALASLVLVACTGPGGGAPNPPTPPAPALTAIAITPTSCSLVQGTTCALAATGTYADASTATLTSSVTWSSSQPTIASVGAGTGLVSGLLAGTAAITAALGGVTSPAATVTVTATTPPPTLTGLAVTPATASIGLGGTASFSATGTYADASTADLTSSVTWSSSTTAVATIAAGVATAVGAGTSAITASLGGVTSSAATLTVHGGTLVSIAVTGAIPTLFPSPSVAVASTLQLKATGTYSDATTAELTTSVAWSSSDPAVAAVDPATGLASGLAEGQCAITAAVGGVTSPAVTLTVHWTYTIRALTLGGTNGRAWAINGSGQVAGDELLADGWHCYRYGSGAAQDLGSVGVHGPLYLNATGQVAGTLMISTGGQHAFLYSGVAVVDLGTLGGANSQPRGLNDSGYVVGGADLPTPNGDGFLYRDGPPMVDLGTGGASYLGFFPVGINDGGLITGFSLEAGTYLSHAFIWEGGRLTDLGMLGGAWSGAVAINGSGQVAGYSQTAAGGVHAFLYSGGVLTDIGSLGDAATAPGGSATPTALNDAGQVVGWSIAPSLSYDAFLYSGGAMLDLGDTGGTIYTDNRAVYISNPGQVVGGLMDYGLRSRGFLYSKGLRWWLQDLVPGAAAAGWTELYRATGINDSGLIIGSGLVNGQRLAFLLEPITHP